MSEMAKPTYTPQVTGVLPLQEPEREVDGPRPSSDCTVTPLTAAEEEQDADVAGETSVATSAGKPEPQSFEGKRDEGGERHMASPLQSSELQRDPKHEKGDHKGDVEEEKESEPARKIFLGGLSLDASKQTVEEHFIRYGELEDVRVPLHKVLTGKSRGFGFVTFKDAAIAAEVVKMVHKICGREVDVKFAVPRAPSSSPATTVSDAIADAEQGSTPADQRAVQSGKMSLDKDDQPSRRNTGSGVRGRNQGVATQRTTNNQTTDTSTHQKQNCSGSTTSTVSSATLSCTEVSHSTDGSGAEESSFKIFVGGLAGTVTQAVLRNYFGQFGALSQATVMIDRETNRSRGFGFVTFADATGMHRALKTEVHNINGKPAEVKEAIPRDVLDKQRQQRSQVAAGPAHKSTNVRSASVDMYAFGVPSSIYYFAPHAPVHPHFAVSPKAHASQMPDGSPSGSPRGRAKTHGTRPEMPQSPREESQNATATPVSVIYPPYVAHQHHHAPYSQPGEHVVSPVHYQVPQGAFFYGGPLPFADYNVYGFGVPHFQHAADAAAARGAHEAAAGNYAYHPHYAHQSQISHMHEQHRQRAHATVNVASTHDGATNKMQSPAPAAAAVPSAAPPAAVPAASSTSPSSPSTPTTASSNTSA